MKLVISTQLAENYGDADNPYWKFKGGEVYVADVKLEDLNKSLSIQPMASLYCDAITVLNPMYEETVIDWALYDDSENYANWNSWEEPWSISFDDSGNLVSMRRRKPHCSDRVDVVFERFVKRPTGETSGTLVYQKDDRFFTWNKEGEVPCERPEWADSIVV